MTGREATAVVQSGRDGGLHKGGGSIRGDKGLYSGNVAKVKSTMLSNKLDMGEGG